MTFYDEAWKELQRQYPLVAKKLEELRCDCTAYDQFRLEIDALKSEVKTLRWKLGLAESEVEGPQNERRFFG